MNNDYPLGGQYKTLTHAYEAAKTNNEKLKRAILAAPTPEAARKLTAHIRIRPDFDPKATMKELVHWKYVHYPELRSRLVLTLPNKLVNGQDEGTPENLYWGAIQLPVYPFWIGENWLGLITAQERQSWLQARPNPLPIRYGEQRS